MFLMASVKEVSPEEKGGKWIVWYSFYEKQKWKKEGGEKEQKGTKKNEWQLFFKWEQNTSKREEKEDVAPYFWRVINMQFVRKRTKRHDAEI